MIAFEKEELLGLFEPILHPDFVILNQDLELGTQFLRLQVAESWMKMVEAAAPDGVELKAVSTTRNFERQKSIWENKWFGRSPVNKIEPSEFAQLGYLDKAREIMKYSAMPGTSRHHWGTDIDINSVEPDYFETPYGRNVFRWLQVNANKYGFAMPYNSRQEGRLLGYEEEKWHWSYLPLSRLMMQQYISVVHYSDIAGFEGCHAAEPLQVIPNFVMAIAQNCR
jgi:LAS superfamily LD-carboxypeptidase LdcB